MDLEANSPTILLAKRRCAGDETSRTQVWEAVGQVISVRRLSVARAGPGDVDGGHAGRVIQDRDIEAPVDFQSSSHW